MPYNFEDREPGTYSKVLIKFAQGEAVERHTFDAPRSRYKRDGLNRVRSDSELEDLWNKYYEKNSEKLRAAFIKRENISPDDEYIAERFSRFILEKKYAYFDSHQFVYDKKFVGMSGPSRRTVKNFQNAIDKAFDDGLLPDDELERLSFEREFSEAVLESMEVTSGKFVDTNQWNKKKRIGDGDVDLYKDTNQSSYVIATFIAKLLFRTPIDEDYTKDNGREHKANFDSIIYHWQFRLSDKSNGKSGAVTEMSSYDLMKYIRLDKGYVMNNMNNPPESFIEKLSGYIDTILHSFVNKSWEKENGLYLLEFWNDSPYFEALEYGTYSSNSEKLYRNILEHGVVKHHSVMAPIGMARATLAEFMSVSSRGKDIAKRFESYGRNKQQKQEKVVVASSYRDDKSVEKLSKSLNSASAKYKNAMRDLAKALGI